MNYSQYCSQLNAAVRKAGYQSLSEITKYTKNDAYGLYKQEKDEWPLDALCVLSRGVYLLGGGDILDTRKTLTGTVTRSESIDIEFEKYVAEKYINKLNNARKRGIEFDISIMSIRNILSAKRCYYTGVELTRPIYGMDLRPTDITIDRVDANKGYVRGNVVACCYEANQFKAMIEYGKFGMKGKKLLKVLDKMIDV